jgi:tol-pal system protein YbgF
MRFRRLLLLILVAFPVICPAVSKEILELQREVAQLQDSLDKLKSSLDTKFGTLTAQLQGAVDASNRTNSTRAAMQGAIQEQLRSQGKEVVAPVAGLGSKVDQMLTEFQEVRNSMSDATTRLGKLEQQILDLSNQVRTMNTPAAPPPSSGGSASTTSPPTATVPPISGDVLYQNAYRDKLGGKSDLALQEFNDYLKYYGQAPLAPAAQFWIGDIYFTQGDYESALKAFDTVLVQYPANNKTPDAFYMKGRTLVKLDRRNAGAAEFRELIKRYPGSELATKARAQLKSMGLSASSVGASRSASRRR